VGQKGPAPCVPQIAKIYTQEKLTVAIPPPISYNSTVSTTWHPRSSESERGLMTTAIGINMSIMRSLLIALFICTSAYAGHSTGNGTCADDITHYENMTVNNKRSDAPLYDRSQAMYKLGKDLKSVWQCENYMEEALRMIRKTNGEYATE